MILPIVGYGHPTLRKVAQPIGKDYPELRQLVADMFETMYHTEGVGLAAPQINKSIRLFVIDCDPFKDKYPDGAGVKKVFIIAEVIELSGEPWSFKEGCLSLPDMGELVERPSVVKLYYLDENFVEHEDTFDGIVARVIQHEYDHLEGKCYVDRISPMRKMLLKNKLRNISEGNGDVDYKIIFPNKKHRR